MYGTTDPSYNRRRYPYDGNNVEDDHSDSSSSTDFRADPFKAFRPSLFGALKSPPDDGDGSEEISGGGPNETLPSLQDKSWIGARMSPIHSNDDDDNTASRNGNNNIGADFDPYATNFPSRQPSGFVSLSQQHVPSAGHARTEYPPFGIHPLQPTKWPLSPPGRSNNAAIPWLSRCQNVGTFVCGLSGLSLLGMGIYDLYYYYYFSTATSTNQHPPLWDTKWTLPYGQPSGEAKIILGGLVPNSILFQSQYWRLITSALQCNSILEWLCLLLAWFVCQRQSIHPISWATILTVHTLSTVAGQLWMLAIWLLGSDGLVKNMYRDNSQQGTLVTHCAAWGTCGVLCFVGMARPNRRFCCFMICIALVVLSLLQHLTQINSLPVVVGCTASSFVGWTLFGSQLIPSPNTTTLRLAQKPDNFSIPILTGPPQSQIHSTVRLCCGAVVMILWVLPLLILAYLDYWEGYLSTKTSSS